MLVIIFAPTWFMCFHTKWNNYWSRCDGTLSKQFWWRAFFLLYLFLERNDKRSITFLSVHSTLLMKWTISLIFMNSHPSASWWQSTRDTKFMNQEENCRVSVPADIYFLPWKSSVHKFISTIWQAVNGHNLAGMSFPPFSLKKRVVPLFMAWLETINDNSTQHIAQDGWKIKSIYLKMLSYIYKKRVLNWPP